MKKILSIILVAIFLINCSVLAFAANEPDSSEFSFTAEQLVEAYRNKDMEIINQYLYEVGVPAEQINPEISLYWASSDNDEEKMCHEQMVAYSYLIFLSCMQTLYGTTGTVFTLTDIQNMIVGVRNADKEENENGFSGHFYDPDKGRTWDRENPDDNAKTRIADKYLDALIYQLKGDRARAMETFGRAIHYMQDINEPHHASNQTILTSNHLLFESTASKLLPTLFEDDLISIEATDAFFQEYAHGNIQIIAHEQAIYAKSFYDLANSLNSDKRKTAAIFTMSAAMRCTAGMLYRFIVSTDNLT